MIQFRCECGKLLQAREEQAGMEAACPICGHVTTVPPPPETRPAFAVAPEPAPAPEGEPAEMPRLPVLRPETPARPPRSSVLRPVLVALFVLGLIVVGVSIGLRRNSDESRAVRMLEQELPRQHGIQVRSIDLQPLPAEHGGEKGDFIGTVTDTGGQVRELVRVRVRGSEVQWVLRDTEEKLRAWVEEKAAKLCDAKIESYQLRRTPDNRRVGTVVTTTGVELELEEQPILSSAGRLTVGQTRLQVARASMPRHWELTIKKAEPNLAEVTLKEEGDESWAGTATDRAGGRYAVSVKRGALVGQPGDEEKGEFVWQLIPIQEK